MALNFKLKVNSADIKAKANQSTIDFESRVVNNTFRNSSILHSFTVAAGTPKSVPSGPAQKGLEIIIRLCSFKAKMLHQRKRWA